MINKQANFLTQTIWYSTVHTYTIHIHMFTANKAWIYYSVFALSFLLTLIALKDLMFFFSLIEHIDKSIRLIHTIKTQELK